MTAERFISLIALIAMAQLCAAQDKKPVPVTLSLQWFAQPEDGEFFAAKAEGIYEKHGLDVTIKPGGPQVNIHQLLAAGLPEAGAAASGPPSSPPSRPTPRSACSFWSKLSKRNA